MEEKRRKCARDIGEVRLLQEEKREGGNGILKLNRVLRKQVLLIGDW